MGRKRENITTYPLAGLRLKDLVALFPGGTTGMAIMYRGLAGWVADYVATSDLSDVDLAGLGARSLLVYDVGAGEWQCGYLAADDLTDFDTSGVATNCMLRFDGTNWVVIPPPTADGDILMNMAGTLGWASVYGFSWNIEAWEDPVESFVFSGGVAVPAGETVLESFTVVVV